MNRTPFRVLFVTLDLDLGGMQRVIQQLISGLDRTLFEPHLCCFDKGGMFYDTLLAQGVHGHILQRRPGPLDLRLLLRLFHLVRDQRINVIHSHNSCGFYAAIAGRLAGVRNIVHTDHGRVVPDTRARRWEDRIVSHLVDSYVGVSEDLTGYLADHVGIAGNRLRTVINGVDTGRFKPVSTSDRQVIRRQFGWRAENLVIGTVCRFDPVKNLPFLLKSMPEILAQIPNAKLVLVGEGAVQHELERIVRNLALERHVEIWPRQRNVEQVLPALDVYACSSISEGTSMTILEAMACGVPVVASAVGGNSHLLDPQCGVLFEPQDRAGFVQGVVSLLLDPSMRESMGRESRRRADTIYRMAVMVDRYQTLYQGSLQPLRCG